MTIPVQDAVTSSVANGVTTVFPFGFKILSESDLVVLLDDVEATSGFTVSGVGSDSGGNVTFTVPPANGVKVTRALQPELKRDVDYQQFGDWLSPEVNNDFDRIWLALQMLNHNDKRSLRISVDNIIDQTILETPAERAGKIIGFDASGNVILYAGNDIDTGLVSALIANFLATTTQLDARNVIGAGDMDIADAQAETGVSFTTAGSAGTLTVTTSPAYGTLATGQRMRLKFNVASTGTDTLNRDTTGAKLLKQYDSTGTKVAAAFAANQLADVVYDGTDYVLLDSLPSVPAASVLGAFRNLQASANGTSANVSVTADEIVLEDSSNAYKTLRNVSLTIAGTTTGANALDTGTIAASTWYALWVIAKADGTTAGLLSLSATAPTLPSGYTFKARVGWIRTDGTANKYPLGFTQYGRRVQYKVAAGGNVPNMPIMANGATGSTSTPTWTAVGASAFVPPSAAKIALSVQAGSASSQPVGVCPNNSYGSRTSLTNPPFFMHYPTNAGNVSVFDMILESSNIYWACEFASVLCCNGWEDNI